MSSLVNICGYGGNDIVSQDIYCKNHWNQLRTILADSWALLKASSIPENKKMACFGRLACRVCLHVMQKEKMGREVDGHKDLPAIAKLFTEELAGTAVLQAQPKSDKNDQKLEVCETLTMSKKSMALLQNGHIKEKEKQLGYGFCIAFGCGCPNGLLF